MTGNLTLSGLQMGFETQADEFESVSLPLSGKIPNWLNGDLVRNGPGKFEVDVEPYRHWFDGLAKLHKFSIAGGEVKATCKFLQSEAYRKALSEHRIALAEFATNPHLSLFEKLGSVFNHQLTDNGNVNVALVNSHYLALTETIHATEFNLETLSTVGSFSFDDKLQAQITTAHPQYDFERKQLYNLLIKLGPSNSYLLYRIEQGTSKRTLLSSIPVKEPCYFHSFGMSANYIILVECPFVVNPVDVILGSKTYAESYSWKPDNCTQISVYSKDDGHLVARGETEAFFTFHHVNAFEEAGDVVVDLLAYPDPQIVKSTYLANLRSPDASVPVANLKRLRITQSTKRVTTEYVSDAGIELARIADERCSGRPYRYLYASGQGSGPFLDQLVKVNTQTGEKTIWRQEDSYPGEPVFVARPGGVVEDDGVLISVVLDGTKHNSFLLILDAASMNELARLEIPFLVPFGFHGQFFKRN